MTGSADDPLHLDREESTEVTGVSFKAGSFPITLTASIDGTQTNADGATHFATLDAYHNHRISLMGVTEQNGEVQITRVCLKIHAEELRRGTGSVDPRPASIAAMAGVRNR